MKEVINHFAQVRELAKKMLQENHYASKDIKTQKEFLDRGCRSFAMRMNRRRDVILTSLKFHKSAGEVRGCFDLTSRKILTNVFVVQNEQEETKF